MEWKGNGVLKNRGRRFLFRLYFNTVSYWVLTFQKITTSEKYQQSCQRKVMLIVKKDN